MKILYLGPLRNHMIEFLRSYGDDVRAIENRINAQDFVLNRADMIVSYGYRYILHKDVLSRFERRAINLHISFLPWNRGADPNLWSFLEDTPKGVSIHYLDPGIDTGDILAQKEVLPDAQDTLRTSYVRLHKEIESLFVEIWPAVRIGKHQFRPQEKSGSFHLVRDRAPFEKYLTEGWDTPVKKILGLAKTVSSESGDTI